MDYKEVHNKAIDVKDKASDVIKNIRKQKPVKRKELDELIRDADKIRYKFADELQCDYTRQSKFLCPFLFGIVLVLSVIISFRYV